MNVRARLALLPPGKIDRDIVVRIEGGRIAEVRRGADVRAAGERIDRDLGEVLLLPGLVNAHCHLDYTIMRGALLGPKSFTEWIRRLNAIRRSLGEEDVLASIQDGFQRLTRHGITTVANIESYPELIERLGPPPVRTFWFQELIDVRRAFDPDETIAHATGLPHRQPHWLGGVGLSPHSPYTASFDLFSKAAEAARQAELPITTHLGESREETRMFTDSSGSLYHFLGEIGRSMEDCGPGHPSPLRRLAEAGVLRPDWIVAHLNEIATEDWELLEPGGLLHGLTIVHCPQSHEFFGHNPFRMERLLACGAQVCLGTDSLASGKELSLFREMALAREYHPRIAPSLLWKMVSTTPASALGLEGSAGVLQTGAFADLTAIPCETTEADPWDTLCDLVQHATFTMVAGEIVFESRPE